MLFRFKTNLPLLLQPFSSSDPQSLLFSIQTEKKIYKVTALRQSIGFCRSQNPVCKGTDHQEWLSPQYVCVCTFQRTHHRCHHHLPLNGNCFISSRNYPALLSSPMTLLKPYTCRSVHCASSCISSLRLECSQSNDCQLHASTTSIHSTDARNLNIQHCCFSSPIRLSGFLQLLQSIINVGLCLHKLFRFPRHWFFYDHTPPSEKPTQSIGFNTLNNQGNWSTSSWCRPRSTTTSPAKDDTMLLYHHRNRTYLVDLWFQFLPFFQGSVADC